MFEEALGARADLLLADMQEYPDAYTQEQRELAYKLASSRGTTVLSGEQRALLDQATLEFYSSRVGADKETAFSMAKKPPVHIPEASFPDLPDAEPEPFWWVDKV